MKKLKLNLPLMWLSIIFAAILAVSVVIACVFGFNTSVELGGGRRVKINVTGSLETAKIKNQAESVIASNGLVIENSYVEDSLGESYVVIVSKNNDKVNYEELKVLVSNKTGVEADKISNFETISGSVSSRYFIMLGVSLIVVLAVLFIAGLIRYRIAGALILVITMIVNVILHLALINLTRVPLASNSFVAVIISSVIALMIVVVILETTLSKQRTKAFSDLSEFDLVNDATNESVIPALLLTGFSLVFSVALICLPANAIKFLGLSSVLGLVSALFTCLFAVSLYTILLTFYNAKAKQKTSKNPNYNKKKR